MNHLLREAAEWRLIGLLFECPREEWTKQVAALAAEIGDAELLAAAEAARREASEGLYHSLFGPGGPAPPREVSYRDSVELGHLMSELASYYYAFAYRPATAEPEDHVAVEAGYVGYLRLKEAYALDSGNAEQAEITAAAAKHFIDDHLSQAAGPLATALASSGVAYLSLAGAALLRRTGPPRQAPATLPVLSQELEDCEGAGSCGSL